MYQLNYGHRTSNIRNQIHCASRQTTQPSCVSRHKYQLRAFNIISTSKACRYRRGCRSGQPRYTVTIIQPKCKVALIGARTIALEDVLRSQHRLLSDNNLPQQSAKQWLKQRGFSHEMIEFYQIGLERWDTNGKADLWAIALHIPANREDRFYRKLQIAPWLSDGTSPNQNQADIPATIFYTYLPDDAVATWLCENEWDAMHLGWLARKHSANLAVCCSTASYERLAPQNQLNELPGKITLFLNHRREQSAIAIQTTSKSALKGRTRIARIPALNNCATEDWSISDAITTGFSWIDFKIADLASEPADAQFTQFYNLLFAGKPQAQRELARAHTQDIDNDPITAISVDEMLNDLQPGDLVEAWVENRWQPAIYVCTLGSRKAEALDNKLLIHLHGRRGLPYEITPSEMRLVQFQHNNFY